MKTVAIYGELGSYTEQAAIKYFGKAVRPVANRYISEVFESVEKGLDYGIVPIENSIEGAVTQTYDELTELRLHIVGETIIRINHCLIANRGVKLGSIKRVYSHPQALGQCKEYLKKLGAHAVPFYDTAGSVKMLMDERMPNIAAIASARAAGLYKMEILARDIETDKNNYTRFFIVSRKEMKGKGNKTSLVFTLKSYPGSLYYALDAFAENQVNLTYIQSRPVLGQPWKYNFYVDFDGDKNDKNVKAALGLLRHATKSVKILGSYAKAEQM